MIRLPIELCRRKSSRGVPEQVMAQLKGYPVSVRARNSILHAYCDGSIPDVEIATLRRLRQRAWLRIPNCGKRTLAELDALVGGFPHGRRQR